MLNTILFDGERGLSFTANLGTTALRVFAGLALMFGHGIHKIPPPAALVASASKIGFPIPGLFAWAAALSEFACAGLLVLGLCTRFSSFFITFTMGVAFFGVHFARSF